VTAAPTAPATGPAGLELFAALLRGELEPPPMAQLMGMELVEASEGRIVFESEPEHRFYNPLGSVHGGFAATLLDSALGCAVHTTLAHGEGYTTLSLEVKYARPITVETGTVRVVGEVEQRGRRQATASARLYSVAEDKLLAHGTTTCIIVRP
jgi:uncharacterized protein (TIGR00369 family)